MSPNFQHTAESQQNAAKQHPVLKKNSYENFGPLDNYQSLNIENVRSGTYQMLQINNEDKNYHNESLVLNSQKSDKKSKEFTNDTEGIITASNQPVRTLIIHILVCQFG